MFFTMSIGFSKPGTYQRNTLEALLVYLKICLTVSSGSFTAYTGALWYLMGHRRTEIILPQNYVLLSFIKAQNTLLTVVDMRTSGFSFPFCMMMLFSKVKDAWSEILAWIWIRRNASVQNISVFFIIATNGGGNSNASYASLKALSRFVFSKWVS